MEKKYPDPVITKTAILIELHEPIYGSHFGVWDKWLKIAKEGDLWLVVTTPFGKATYKYKDYMKGAVKKERYYKNPDEPMVFWCRDMLPDIKKREERKKEEAKQSQGITKKGAEVMLNAMREVGIGR